MKNDKYKVVFVSNFMNHHQLPVATEMNSRYEYTFIATEPISEEQSKMKYDDMNKKYPFILCSYESEENYQKAITLINDADVVVFGSCPFDMIEKRIADGKHTFRYSERIFKEKTLIRKFHPVMWAKYYGQCAKYKSKNYYLLCASAYASKDYAWFGAFKNKTYKWGYFPPVEELDVEEVLKERRKNDKLQITWCNRLVRYKHPEMAINTARHLQKKGVDFVVDIIGVGYLKEKLEKLIDKYSLKDKVNLLGSMPTQEVRQRLKKSDIVLLTADKGEGWGAVVNEAMNSACAILCNKYTGSVPYLVEDGKSGMIYSSNKEFYRKLDLLVKDEELRATLGKNAYVDVVEEWSAKKAAENFDKLITSILTGTDCEIKTGPCSKA